MTNTTDTQRTDAFVVENSLLAFSEDKYELTIVHARQLERELNEAEAEVDRLKAQLARAVKIAEEFWNNQKQAVTVYHGELADELNQIKATLNQDNK